MPTPEQFQPELTPDFSVQEYHKAEQKIAQLLSLSEIEYASTITKGGIKEYIQNLRIEMRKQGKHITGTDLIQCQGKVKVS